MRKVRILSVACLTISVLMSNAFAQFLEPPFAGQTITTDFGPRIQPVLDATWFHAGIDYSPAAGDADAGYDIPAIEPAVITAIGRQGTAGWVVNFYSTENPNREWSYLHTFENVTEAPSALGRFELGKLSDGAHYIIRFTNASRTTVDKAFIDDEHNGWPVTSQAGQVVVAYSAADYREAVAPLGVSGIGTGAHLHLNFNHGADNPFEVLFHPSDILPVAAISMPENGEVIPVSELDRYVFMAEIHSEGGLDLDKVSFWIYKNKDKNQAIHLGTPGLPTFGYGGRVGEGQNGFPFYSSFGGATGVQPVSLGHDNFIFRQNLNNLNLPDGEHSFVVNCKDVNDNDACLTSAGELASVDFIADLTPPGARAGDTEGFIYGQQTKPVVVVAGPTDIFLTDDVLGLCEGISGLCDKISGIKSVKLLKDAAIVFDPMGAMGPVKELTIKLPELPAGEYALLMEDVAGNETFIPTTISPVSLEVSTAASSIRINRDEKTFTGKLHIKAQSNYGITGVALIDSRMTSVAGENLSGTEITNSLEMDIDFGGNLSEYYMLPNQYGVGFVDQAGRIVWQPVNLTFGRQNEYKNTYPVGQTSDFNTPVIDLVQAEEAMLPGAIMSVFAPTEEDMASQPRWVWESRNGFYGFSVHPPCAAGQDCTTEMRLPIVDASKQAAGRVKVITKTSDNPDMTDAVPYPPVADRNMFLSGQPVSGTCGNQLGYEEGMNIGPFCYTENAPTSSVIELKRYVQTSVTIEKAVPTETSLQGCALLDDNTNYCKAIYDYAPTVLAAGPDIYGFKVKMGSVQSDFAVPLPAGSNVTSLLPDGLVSNFGANTVFKPGMLRFGYASAKTYPGFQNLSGNLAYSLRTEAVFDHARLTIPYIAAGLTEAQEAGIQVYRITDSGEYIALGASVDAVGKKVVSGEMNTFGRIMVAAPRYVDPRTVAAATLAAGRPEMEFTAESVSVEHAVYTTAPEGITLLSAVAANGIPIGNIYRLGTENLALSPPGTLKMHFDPSSPGAQNVRSLEIYRAELDGSGASRVPGVTVDPVNHEVAVEIHTPSGLYILVGSTAADVSDTTPPVAQISFGSPKYLVGDRIYISTLAQVALSGSDPAVSGGESSGVAALHYLLDISPILQSMATYAGPFTLKDGVRAIYYAATDGAGNASEVSSSTVYVDGVAPETQIVAGGTRYQTGATAYITSGDTITLSASDSGLSGAGSGLNKSFYLVDREFQDCPAIAQYLAGGQSPTGPPGTCENPIYAGPFFLPPGEHAVNYLSFDNVWNAESPKTFHLTVTGGDTVPPETFLIIDGSTIPAGGTAEIAPETLITISAIDPVSTGTVSGLKDMYFLIDTTMEACGEMGPVVPTAPAGSCQNYLYTAPFTLMAGTHTISYTAVDNAGNISIAKSARFVVTKAMPFPRAYEFSGKFPINSGYFLTRDKEGNSYVASFGEISKYGPSGTFITKWGSYGSGPGQFGSIWAIRTGPDGNIYALDLSNRNIQKFTSGGAYLSTIKGSFQSPQGLDIDKNGNFYVADAGTGQVVVLSTAGVVLRSIAAANCLDVAVDGTGNIYAGDNSNKTVKKFSSDGNLLATFTMPAGTYRVFSIAVDPYGNVYAADIGNSSGSRIVVFTSAGAYTGEFGTSATTPGGAIGNSIAKMELDEESGKLYLPQSGQVFIYKALADSPAAPRIVSPTGKTGIFNSQVLVYLQAAPGQKIEVFDGDILSATGYVDDVEGGFSATLSLAAGAHALSAKAKSNLGFDSERTAVVNVAVQPLRVPAFSQAVSIPVRGYPYSQVIATTTVTGDFNGDHLQDIVAIGKWSYTVLLGRGDGNFDEQLSVNYESYNWGGSPGGILVWEAAAEDVNKDGKLDFVMTSLGRVLTAIGYGDGTFRLVDSGYVPSCSTQYIIDTDFKVGDVNNDGYPDVVKSVRTAAASGGSCIYVLLGTGDGKFNLSSTKSGLSANGAVNLQDFNQNGSLDIANGQGIFWNDGAGAFGNYQEMCPSCVKAVSADINSDGLPDLVYDYKFIRFNLGNGKFSRPVTWDLNWQNNGTIGKPVISDFNGDTVSDLAVGVGNTWDNQGKVFVYPGYGDGRFAPDPISLYVGNNYSQIDTISIADFNNDTRTDIIAALHFNTEYLTPEIAFFYNNTLVPDMTPPSASVIIVSPDPEGGAKVAWTAPGDDWSIGKATRYDLRFAQTPVLDDAGFAAAGVAAGLPAPKTAGTAEGVVVAGLTGGVTYYFALKTYDEIGNASSLSNSPGFFAHYVTKSTQSVNGKAEVSVISRVSPELTFIDITSGDGALAAQTARSQDLSGVSNVYKTGFGAEYDYSGVLTFRYSAAALSAQGLLESEIGIYEYFPETGWSRLDGQVLNAADRKIIAPLNSTSTICGIFGSTPKLLSPVDNAALYTEAPLFVGRICENCSLKVYESGILKGEFVAQTGGFISGNISFLPGAHAIEAVVVKNDAPQSASIYRKFTVRPPFALTFDTPVMISTETRYDVGSSGLGVADFNGDKHDDLLIFGRSGYVSALGNGTGQFSFLNPVFITLNHVFRVETPDLNGDGKADIVAGNLYGGLLGAYGAGNGTFGSIISLPNDLNISDDITSGDFNKDGNIDLALVGYNPTTYTRDISLLRGQGGANFTRKYISRPVYSDGNVKFAEIDADNNTDLVNGGTVLYGDGQGNFSNVLTVDSNCMRSLVGDFNGDGNKDIACIRNYSNFVDIYASLKNRTFRKTQSLQLPTSLADVGAVVDLNNDGIDDLVIGSYSGKLYVLTAKGDGTFADPFPVSLDSRISTVKIIKTGDFDEDGKKDLAIGHYFAPIAPQAVSLVFNRSEGIDRIPPGIVSDLAVNFNVVSGDLVLSWTAPGDDGQRGQAAGYDLRFATIPVTEANFGQAMPIAGVPAPGVSGSSESFTAAGLAAGATYYFALKATDEVENVSGVSNSPGLFLNFIARSISVVEGNTELSMIAPVQPYITHVSTVSEAWTIALGEAAGLSLTIGSGMFEIAPEGEYNPPAMLTFYYSTTTLSSVGLTEDDVAVYEHFADRSWVKLDGQINDKLNHKITVPVTRIASLFGIFGVIKDKTPPLTAFVVEGSSRPFAAGIHISAASSISLGAYDPVVFGTSSGVAFTEFRVDASSITPFSAYEAPFRVSTGTHTVEFRSVDKSGNIEKEHLLNVIVDGIAPDVVYGVIGKSFLGDGIAYVASGSSVTLVSTDTASGVSRLFYEVNGTTYSAVSAEAIIYLSSSGFYGIAYNAEDNVGNAGVRHAVSLYVDTAAPTTNISLSSATGDNGWHATPLAVTITSVDDMAGVERTYYRMDGSSFAVYAASLSVAAEGTHVLEAYSIDNVGNLGDIRAAVFGVDLSTPDVNYSLLPVSNTDGWNSGPTDVIFTGTDTVSGVSYCSSSFTVTGEGLNIPVSGYCRDYAGWSSTSSFSLNIDTSAPASIQTLAGSVGSNGWYITPVLVALNASDNLSGLAGLQYSVEGSSFSVYSSTFAVGAPGAHVLKYYAADKAGNVEPEKLAEFKVDLEAPVVEAAASPAPNVHGWNNSAVNVVFTGTDSISGLAYCEPQKTVALEGSSQTVTGYCLDYSGWSSTASLILNIDTTSPRISYTAAPAANSLGWNNGDISVKFACTDYLSGVMSCPAEISLSDESADISTMTRAMDYAGNFAGAAVSGLKIDRTPPASGIDLSGPQRNGWYSGPLTITLVSTDALSGVKEILYVLDDSTPVVYNVPLVIAGDGEHTIKYYASDNADNLEGYKSAGFRIDTVTPEVGYRQAPPHNSAGWNNTVVEIVIVGTDPLSGIEACSSATVALEGQGISIPGWCRDLAGNIGYATATVNIDMTPAGIGIASPQAGQTYVATRGRVEVSFIVADNFDPAPGVEAFLVQTEDKGSPRGQRPARIAVTSGQAIEPLDIDDGLWRLVVNTTDFALNTSSSVSGIFEIIHDVLAPRSVLSPSGALYSASGAMYITSATAFSLASLDDLVSPGDAIGLGVKSQSVRLNSSGVMLKELSFVNPAPRQATAFASAFSLGALLDLPDGTYDISYGAEDILANVETSLERRYLLDNTRPVTQYSVAGVSYLADGKLYVNSSASLGLAGVDVSSGGVASGLMATKFRLDGGAWSVYASTFTLAAPGAHTLEYHSVDNVQNTEVLRLLNIVVDNTAPMASATIGEPQFDVFGLRIITPDTPVTLAAADPGATGLTSGVKAIYYELIYAAGGSAGVRGYTEPFKIGAQGTYLLRYWAQDNAGNVSAPLEQRLMVSSLQSDALDAVAGLEMTGNADIAGTVKSNTIVSLGGSARILGDVSASTITVTGNAQITGQRITGPASLVAAPLYMPAIMEIASNTNSNSLIPAKYLPDGKLVVSAKAELTLSTGIYYFSGIDLKGGASVILNGKVDILVAGDVSIAGGASFNAAGAASRLNIFLSTASTLSFSGGGNLAAYVYAPYSDLKLTGNALLGGHYFVRSAAISGNGNLIQAGESLPAAAASTGGGKKVSALASGSSYSVLAGPDPEFKLGEVYVYPNPAKGGAAPTLHLECGIADKVNIKMFTVSGREAHEYTITASPVALDDGNGLSYAYEYTWQGHIPSGVYYYFIEAERAGKKIKKTGKFAVVR